MNINDIENINYIDRTRRAFQEIAILYTLFEHNPFQGLSIIENQATTRKRMQSNQVDRMNQFSKLQNRVTLHLPQADGTYKTISVPVYEQFEFQLSYEYFVTGNDVSDYLLQSRVMKLQYKWLDLFTKQLQTPAPEIDIARRTSLTTKYRYELSTLNDQLERFDGIRAGECLKRLEADMADTASNSPAVVEDWQDIYLALMYIRPLIKRAANSYLMSINDWVPEIRDAQTPKSSVRRDFYFDC